MESANILWVIWHINNFYLNQHLTEQKLLDKIRTYPQFVKNFAITQVAGTLLDEAIIFNKYNK